jgi:hypothetical protein
MKPSTFVVRLSWLIAALALGAVLAGIFWPAHPQPGTFTSIHGQEVTLFGRGLYRNDSLLIGAGFRGIDLLVLVLGIPLLVYAAVRYRRGSFRGGLLLAGALAFFLYQYTSMSIGAMYNPLIVVYLLLFTASLFAYVAALHSFDLRSLPAHVGAGFPHRALVIYLYVVAAVLFLVWFGLTMLPPLLTGTLPMVEHYTTVITYLMDLGILAPASFAAAWLLQKRQPLGYLLAATMLVISWTVGSGVGAATVAQFYYGYPYTVGQVVGLVAPFLVLAGVGIWLTVRFLQGIAEQPLGALRAANGRPSTRTRAGARA